MIERRNVGVRRHASRRVQTSTPAASYFRANARQALQLAASAVSLYSPSSHAVHTWSLVVVPAVLTYVPSMQVLYAVQAAAFVVLL